MAKAFIPSFSKKTIPGYAAAAAAAFALPLIPQVKEYEGKLIDMVLGGWKTSIEAKPVKDQAKSKTAYNVVVDVLSGGIRSLEAVLAGGVGNMIMKRKFFSLDTVLISIIAGYAAALTIAKPNVTKL